jgi:hypothetical protein
LTVHEPPGNKIYRFIKIQEPSITNEKVENSMLSNLQCVLNKEQKGNYTQTNRFYIDNRTNDASTLLSVYGIANCETHSSVCPIHLF